MDMNDRNRMEEVECIDLKMDTVDKMKMKMIL